MRHKNVSALLTLGAAALILVVSATGANAGCIKLQTRGPLICGDWITGSQEVTITAKGVSTAILDSLWLQVAVLGTYDPDMEVDCLNQTPYNFTACRIPGKIFCENPQDKFNFNGTAFNLPGPLSTFSTFTTCTKGGKCIETEVINAADYDFDEPVCNNNWELLDFVAEEFIGQICYCPGDFDDNWDCCATQDRMNEGGQQVCKKFFGYPAGSIECLVELCTFDGDFDAYTYGDDSVPYDCDKLDVDGLPLVVDEFGNLVLEYYD